MKKFMKVSALLCALALCFSLSACSINIKATINDKTTEFSTQIPNPLTEVSADEQLEATGIKLDAPEGAENVKYFVLDTGDDNMTAQTVFSLNGNEFTYRALASIEDMGDISGMYLSWEGIHDAEVNGRSGEIMLSENGACVNWFDIVPGISYSLGCNGSITEEELMTVANRIFVPTQGEVDGNA